ncbi:MAG: LysR family transcriptional regulator [Anaerolineales bacterium]|nr:LysR family transcriptional regulator [Anaerolineales bacterium]
MEIKQVQYFLAIVETGSFSAAADNLYISQSSLSKQIIALEKSLDVQLFDRSKRKVSLTEAGKVFENHAQNFNELYKSMLVEIGEFRNTLPTLSIAAIPVIAQYGITTHIAKFRAAYPDINLVLEEREASTVLPALTQNKYDLAFVRDYGVDTQQFSILEVVADKLMVAVSKSHPLAYRETISLTELSNENFIMFNKGTLVYELAINACRSAGFEPRVFYSTLRGASIIGLAASNSGVALMMEKVLNYYRRPDVVAIPLKEVFTSKIVIAYMKEKKPSKPAKMFIRYMEKNLNE